MIDDSTGFPEVPDGYFWRVKPSIGGYLRVQLRKRLWFGWSSMPSDDHWSAILKSEASARLLVTAAEYVLERVEREEKVERADRPSGWKLFVGDYPPKSLNKVNQ